MPQPVPPERPSCLLLPFDADDRTEQARRRNSRGIQARTRNSRRMHARRWRPRNRSRRLQIARVLVPIWYQLNRSRESALERALLSPGTHWGNQWALQDSNLGPTRGAFEAIGLTE